MAASVALRVPYTHEWNNPINENSSLKIATVAELARSTGLRASPPQGWVEKIVEELEFSSPEEHRKAFAGVFIHNDGTEGVICFSQSAPTVELFTKNEFNLEDNLPAWEVIDTFVKAALVELQEKRVHVVGYSFGGAIAQLVGYHYGLSSLSLDGPGIGEIIENFHKNHPEKPLNLDQASSAKTVMVAPHAINQLGKHVGQVVFSCPTPSATSSSNPKYTVEKFVSFVKKALQSLNGGSVDINSLQENVCTLAEFTGKFHGSSLFISGKIDLEEGRKMRDQACKMTPKSYSEEQLTSGLTKASLGVSLTTGGMSTKSLSQGTDKVGDIATSAGASLQGWGASVSANAGQGYVGMSMRSVGGTITTVGTVATVTGTIVNVVGKSGELIGDLAQEGGKLVTKAGLIDATSAFGTASTPFFLKHYHYFLEKIEASLTQ